VTYTAAEEALWIDRNSDGVVTLAEWMQFNTDLSTWTFLLQSGDSALTTADVPTNAGEHDNRFFQDGVPALLDADSDGSITWTEWITGFTTAQTSFDQYLVELNGNYAITPQTWLGSEDEATVRDQNGDDVITWPEWWVTESIFTQYQGWLAVNNTNVTLQTFTDAGDSAELQQFYDLDNDTWVPFADYIEVKANLKQFQLMNAAGQNYIAIADQHKYEMTDYQWKFMDVDANDQISEAEWINAMLKIEYDAYMVYEADLAAAIALSTNETTYDAITQEAWTALGKADLDFKWMDLDLNGQLEDWEYEITLFEHNAWILLSADGTADVLLTAYEAAYPTVTTDWGVLFDTDADGAISLTEWKNAMVFWHSFWFTSLYDTTVSDYVTVLDEQTMSYVIGISLDAYQVWFLQLTRQELMESRNGPLNEFATYNQYIEGQVKVNEVQTQFETFTMANSTVGFNLTDSGFSAEKFSYYDWNEDGFIDVDEYTNGELNMLIFESTIRHYYYESVTTEVASEFYGGAMQFADSDNSGFITTEEFYIAQSEMGPFLWE